MISFVGLHSDEQRQGFVNQLQMALFAWIKRNPAGDRPLGGLFVMDEAQTLAPSTGTTACTASTLALASQARKYGLGLVFATQAPQGPAQPDPGQRGDAVLRPAQHARRRSTRRRRWPRPRAARCPTSACSTAGQFYAAAEGLPFVKVSHAAVPDPPPEGTAVAGGGHRPGGSLASGR